MKKILFIANTSLKNPIKGTPLRIRNVMEQISKRFDVVVCSQDTEDNFKNKFYLYPSGNALQRLLFFLKIIKTEKIDIVFANTDIEIRPAVFLKLLSKVKIVIDLHGLYAEELYFEGLIGNFKRILIDKLVKFLLHFYDLIIVTSDNLKDYYIKTNKNIEVIYNGVNKEDFYPIKDLQSDIFTIGYTGNLKPYQGFELLLQSLQNIKKKETFPFKLNLIISSGISQIKELLKKYNIIEDAVIHTKIDHDKVNEMINRSSVLVVPRLSLKMTEYAYPSKLPEYMLTGLPVITTNVGPVQKMLNGCNCCIIIDANDIVNKLEGSLIGVYQMTKEERGILGHKAVDFVMNNLTWDILGEKINNSLIKL